MTILMYPWPEPGHLLPTFALARALQDRGHEVVYACTLDLRDTIAARGFRYEVVNRASFPLGTMRALQRQSGDQRALATPLIWSRIVFDALEGTTARALRAIGPTLVLADVIDWVLPLVLRELGIPCVRMSTSLSQALDELPPITTPLLPGSPEPTLAAARVTARNVLSEKRQLRFALAELCTRFACPLDRIEIGAMVPFLSECPEIVLCPPAFDFPRRQSGPAYFATFPDLDRPERVTDSLRAFCDGDRGALVYVSLGTQTARYRHAARLLDAAIEVARARPDLRIVITADEASGGVLVAGAPPNVHVTHDAPQLWLLRRAALFVTHAGLGSVREAIAHHVPMLALPQAFDQPGNAARVAWHQIGVSADSATIVAAELERHIDDLLRRAPELRERLARLDAAMRADATGTSAIELVEATARGAACGPRWVFVEPGAVPQSDAGHRELTEALVRASGPCLARVELAANGLATSTWHADRTEALCEYTDWCAELALAEDVDHRAELLAGVREYRARIRAGAPRTELHAMADTIRAAHRGRWRYLAADAVVMVYGYRAHEAALLARDMMVRVLASRGAEAGATPVERARLYEEHFGLALQRANAELVRRLSPD